MGIDGVRATPRTGGADRLLTTGVSGIRSIALDEASVYFNGSDVDGSGVFRATKAGAGAVRLATTSDPGNQIAVDGKHVYYADAAGVHRVPVSGGDSMALSAQTPRYALAVDDTYVFWGAEGIWRLRKP